MIKVCYERYYNDFRIYYEKANFSDLDAVKSWMFGLMQWKFSTHMSFPTFASVKRLGADGPWAAEFTPSDMEPCYRIREIFKDEKIIFSDGKYTNGEKFWTKSIQDWFADCKKEAQRPKFPFEKKEKPADKEIKKETILVFISEAYVRDTQTFLSETIPENIHAEEYDECWRDVRGRY